MSIIRSEPTLSAVIRANARAYPDRLFLVEGDRRLSFADFDRAVLDAVRAIMGFGIKPGDRVGVWAPNSAEWLIAAMGIFGAGGILLPINSRLRGPEVADILRRSGAIALFTVGHHRDDDYPRMLQEAAPDLAVDLIDLTARGGGPTHAWRDLLDQGIRAVPAERAATQIEQLEPDSTADVLFTSGTTGLPKGIVLSHAQNVEAWGTDYLNVPSLGPDDRMLLALPLGLMFGLKAVFIVGALACATVVMLPTFRAEDAMRLIEQFKITYLPGPPTLLTDILDSSSRGDYDLSSIRHVHLAGTTIPPVLVRRIREEGFASAITVGYGLSECGPATLTKPDDDVETIATTVGRPCSGVRMRLVDDAGNDVAAGDVGEILLKAPWVTTGYFGDPAQTEAAFTPDGWLRTGDTGSLNEQGYLRFVGRKKDMFIVGGFNVYPAEVERSLMEFGSLSEVAVVPVPHERLGQVGTAFVVPGPDATVDPDALLAWARTRLANYKVPRHVVVVDGLPKNASSKLLRAELRRRAEELAVVHSPAVRRSEQAAATPPVDATAGAQPGSRPVQSPARTAHVRKS